MPESVFNVEIAINEFESLVYNTYSGALFIKAANAPISDLYEVHHSVLLEQGFWVVEDENEINKLEYERFSSIFCSKPSSLNYTISTTMQCQAHCPYCFESGYLTNKKMSMDTALSVFEFIEKEIDATEATKVHITFFGGEPTLNTNVMELIGIRLVECCIQRHISFSSSIITNGILLDAKLAKKLCQSINLQRAQITLDGTRDTHDTIKGIPCFDTVISNIHETYSFLQILIRLNFQKGNHEELVNLLTYLSKQQLFNCLIYLAPVRNYNRSASPVESLDNWEDYLAFKKEVYTNQVKNSLRFASLLPKVKRSCCGYEAFHNYCIGADGTLYKCTHDISQTHLSVGNVYTGANYSDRQLEFHQGIPYECKQKRCSILPICLGRCIMDRNYSEHFNCSDIIQSLKVDLYLHYLTNLQGKEG